MKAILWCSQVAYGIACQRFASFEESRATSIDGFPWTCPENPQDFPWLYVDRLSVRLGGLEEDNPGQEFWDISRCAVCVCDGDIVAEADIRQRNYATRYCIVGDSADKDGNPYWHEFEYEGEFEVNRLTIHYKTAPKLGAPDLRLVTSVEYDGVQIYSAGRIAENCMMPRAGDLSLANCCFNSYLCDYMCDYTICDGWYKRDGDDSHAWKMFARENATQTVVVPAFVCNIAADVFADCRGMERLYIKEDSYFYVIGRLGIVRLNCVKVPESLDIDFFAYEPEYAWCGGRWNSVSNGFFSGLEVHDSEFLFKASHGGQVRWLELRPREFQYICSLAFELPREECDEVGGRWLFTRSLESGKLLLQLASAFMEGRGVEQDFPMALRCCEHACWCAVGDEIPVVTGDVFYGIEVARVDQLLVGEVYEGMGEETSRDDEDSLELLELFERAKRLKETVLTHFQRLEIDMFGGQAFLDAHEYYYLIPDLAFEGREDLRDVLLPDELCDKQVVVGRCSFARCRNLRSITVAGMTASFRIVREETSFLGCDSLSDRIQYSMDCSALTLCLNAPEVCTVCSHVDIIASSAFQWSLRLRRFAWDRYEGEGSGEFVYCARRILGRSAFEGCYNLSSVCLKGWEIAIGAGAFRECRSLNELEFGVHSPFLDMPCLNLSFEEAFAGCASLYRITAIGERGYLVVKDDPGDWHINSMDLKNYLSRWDGNRFQTSVGRWQFRACRMLREIPPIVAMFIPPGMFEGCESLENVRCIVARDCVMRHLQYKVRPWTSEAVFRIETSAFAHCRNLEWFKFYRMRVALIGTKETKAAIIRVGELIEGPSRQVVFGRDAFLGCQRLSRVDSSFASAARSSHPSSFPGCPEFDGFVEVDDIDEGVEFETPPFELFDPEPL